MRAGSIRFWAWRYPSHAYFSPPSSYLLYPSHAYFSPPSSYLFLQCSNIQCTLIRFRAWGGTHRTQHATHGWEKRVEKSRESSMICSTKLTFYKLHDIGVFFPIVDIETCKGMCHVQKTAHMFRVVVQERRLRTILWYFRSPQGNICAKDLWFLGFGRFCTARFQEETDAQFSRGVIDRGVEACDMCKK